MVWSASHCAIKRFEAWWCLHDRLFSEELWQNINFTNASTWSRHARWSESSLDIRCLWIYKNDSLNYFYTDIHYFNTEKDLSTNEVKNNCMFTDESFFRNRRYDNNGNEVQKNSKSPEIERLLHKLNESWKPNINLYLHNCQHFAYYARRIAREEFKRWEGRETSCRRLCISLLFGL